MAFRNVASAYKWVYASSDNLDPWNIAISQYKQMSSLPVVQKAAEAGANVLKLAAQDLIFNQPSLNGEEGNSDYTPVAERFTVWSDDDNTYFGVPEGDPELAHAWEMDERMPVITVVLTTDGAKAVEAFERQLNEQVF